MSLPREEAWFRAKRFGWGWGLPLRWQGWVAMAVYFTALVVGAMTLRVHGSATFAIYLLMLSAALIALCAWKGERPRWRWGDPE